MSRSNTTHNIVANFAGKASIALMGFLFVPVYIRLIGMESYGLIGVFASLTALIGFLDFGLSTTLNRGLARLSARTGAGQEARDLVRTLEGVYWAIGAAVGAGIAAAAPLIAHHWLHAQALPAAAVQRAVALMGLVFVFVWPDSFYEGGLLGLQRQVLLNVVRVGMAVLRSVGAAAVLRWISPTVQAYFLWQAAAFAAQTLLLAGLVWRSLPPAPRPARFRRRLWHENWGFTAGITGIAILATVLTQTDKVLLSRFLPLRQFGYYMLATTIAGVLAYAASPIFAAVFPRFAQLAAVEDTAGLTRLYHRSCQLLSVLLVPAWIMAVLFSRELLAVYIRDPETVARTHLLVSLLVTGTALNALMTLPLALQMAYGWTSLSLYKNVISVLLFLPAEFWMVVHHGAVGAALMWIAVNAGYVALEVPVMHHRLLRGEAGRWYWQDVGLPVTISLGVGLLARLTLPRMPSLPAAVFCIASVSLVALLASALALPLTRRRLTRGGVP